MKNGSDFNCHRFFRLFDADTEYIDGGRLYSILIIQKLGGFRMRLILAIVVFCAMVPVRAEQPSVTVLGVKLVRGMLEADVRAAFPNVNCISNASGSELKLCGLSDGVPPDADGEVSFKDGRVFHASRYWFPSDEANAYDALLMQNEILTSLAGEGTGVCAKVETFSEEYTEKTVFAFPEKILTAQLSSLSGKSVYFIESLRVNPVSKSHKVRGDKMQGGEWCAYIN